MASARFFVRSLADRAMAHEAARHPILDRIARGDLPDMQAALREFAFQYREYSRFFPRYVRAVVRHLQSDEHRIMLQEILDEDCGLAPSHSSDPSLNTFMTRPHTELFNEFQRAVGVDKAYCRNRPIMREVEVWAKSMLHVCDSPKSALGIGAIGTGGELVAPVICSQILTGLDRFTDLSSAEKAYFAAHANHGETHAQVITEIAIDLAQDPHNRTLLEQGAMTALEARATFWRAFTVNALSMPVRDDMKVAL